MRLRLPLPSPPISACTSPSPPVPPATTNQPAPPRRPPVYAPPLCMDTNIVDLGDDDSVTGVERVANDDSASRPTPTDGTAAATSNPPEAKKQKTGTTTSGIWEIFDDLGFDPVDGKPRAMCKGCKKVFIAGKSKYGTSSILRHAKVCPKLNESTQRDVGDMIMDNAGKIRSRRINQVILREKLSTAIIKHGLPYSFVEYEGIRDVLTYCNPDVKTYSRNTAASDVWKIYEAKKSNLKQILADAPSRICLTSDVWTACTFEGYICLTAHFIDANWKLNSFILSFIDFPPPHTGLELANKVLKLLKEWGIEKKIFSLTLDNASNNDCMQDILRDLLRSNHSLFCDGEFFHIRCCAHVLNLIVRDGMGVAKDALSKIRQSVKYVKGSESRMILFEECVNNVGIKMGVHLRLDVTTRWNSTFLMLESALKYRRAFGLLALRDKNYITLPLDEEWVRGEKMCDFLRPFFEITKLMSGSSYPTSNLYFMQVWKIQCLLLSNLSNEDAVIREMVIEMQEKFDKYWKDYSVILALGAVLDPRIKLQLLEMCYNKVDPFSASVKVAHVKEKLNMLFQQYSTNSESVASSSSQEHPHSSCSSQLVPSPFDNAYDLDDVFKMFDTQVVTKAGKNQLEIYLEESKLEWNQFKSLDVLQYWKDNKYRFPDLARMASDVLSIPITTVASESAFSIGARVLNNYRSCLLSKNVQALICTRNWLHGFIPVDDIDVEKVEGTTSKVDSNGEFGNGGEP